MLILILYAPCPADGAVLKEGCHLERSERSFHTYTKMSRCSFATLRTWLDMTYMTFWTAPKGGLAEDE